MAPLYKPQDVNFDSVIRAMNGIEVDPLTLNEAIAQARALEASQLANEQTEYRNRALADNEEMRDSLGNIDPALDLDEARKQAVDILMRNDPQTASSIMDAQRARDIAERRTQAYENRTTKPQRTNIAGVGLVEFGDDGTPKVVVPAQKAAKERMYLLEKDGQEKLVPESDANIYLSSGWRKPRSGETLEDIIDQANRINGKQTEPEKLLRPNVINKVKIIRRIE